MLKWTFIFFLLAVVTGLFGFRSEPSTAANVSKALFFLFSIFFITAAMMWLFHGAFSQDVVMDPVVKPV